MTAYRESRGIAALILNLSIAWKWVVSFMHRRLYLRRNHNSDHCIRGFVGPKGKKTFLPSLESKPGSSGLSRCPIYSFCLRHSSAFWMFIDVRRGLEPDCGQCDVSRVHTNTAPTHVCSFDSPATKHFPFFSTWTLQGLHFAVSLCRVLVWYLEEFHFMLFVPLGTVGSTCVLYIRRQVLRS